MNQTMKQLARIIASQIATQWIEEQRSTDQKKESTRKAVSESPRDQPVTGPGKSGLRDQSTD